jgi:colicin import membrane protein
MWKKVLWAAPAALLMTAGCRQESQSTTTERDVVSDSQRQSENALEQARKAQEQAQDEQKEARSAQQELTEAQANLQQKQSEASKESQEAQAAQRQAQQEVQTSQQQAASAQQQALEGQTQQQQQAQQKSASTAAQAGQQASQSAQTQSSTATQQSVTGSVVRKSSDQLVIKTQDRGEITLSVDPSTSVSVNGQTGSVDSLQEGSQVRASYSLENGSNVATRIDSLGQSGSTSQPSGSGQAQEPATGGSGADDADTTQPFHETLPQQESDTQKSSTPQQ